MAVVAALLLSKIAVAQQLKLGSSPNVLNKSAVLELSTSNQGLLLPRITDTSLINVLNPPDGMIIYFTPSQQFLLRANGQWNAMAAAASLTQYWSATGNNNISTPANFIGTINNASLRFRSKNLERMVIDSNGNVGIAKTAPAEKLDVAGNLRFSGALMPNGSAGTLGYVLTSSGAGAAPTWQDGNSYIVSNAWLQGGNNLSALKNIGTTSNFSLPFVTNNVERMRLTTSGNLGIGTIAPSEKLTVNGGAMFGDSTYSGRINISNSQAAGTATDLYTNNDIMMRISNAGTGQAGASLQLKSSADNFLFSFEGKGGFRYYSRNSLAEKFKVDDGGELHSYGTGSNSFNGRVGIGTLSPSSPLHVVGANPLMLTGVQTGGSTASDSVLTINSGTVQKLPVSNFALSANSWNTAGNSTPAGSFLGTTNNTSLRFRTNNIQRMLIDSLGNVGIGVNDATSPLVVKDTMAIRRVGGLATLLFTNTSGSGDLRIAGDGGDMFWQGGGGRSLQMGSYWGMVLGGDRQTSALPAFINGSGGTNVLIPAQRTASVPLAIQGASGQTANLTEWRNSSNAILNVVNSTGNVGIGSGSFDASNPEKLLVNAGITSSYNLIKARGSINNYLQFNIQNQSAGTNASTDIVATANNGTETSNYVDFGINSSGYTGGYFGDANDGYIYSLGKDFLIGNGTTGQSLRFLTGGGDKATNTRMIISESGNVGIGTTTFDGTSPESLKVDAGTSTYTPILATGNYDGYFQINVKNTSLGTNSSSDLVATANNGTETTNFVNLGINGSNFTYSAGSPIETGKANDGYLISAGQDFYVVNNNASKSINFLTGGTAAANEAMRITAARNVGIGTTNPSERFHVVLPTAAGGTPINTTTIETVNTTAAETSNPPILSLVRQVPSFAASTTYAGPVLSFGFRTSGTANNLAQIQTTGGPTTSKTSFYTRTGMTNSNPATGTLAENMYLDGTALYVRNLAGGATSLSVDANGFIIRTPSDARLKNNVATIESPLEKIKKMRGVTYTWIDTVRFGTQKEMGFLAQELEKVVPEVVNGGGEYKSVNYQVLNALLTEAVKEQQKEIEGLKKDLQDMKAELMEIRSILNKASKPSEK